MGLSEWIKLLVPSWVWISMSPAWILTTPPGTLITQGLHCLGQETEHQLFMGRRLSSPGSESCSLTTVPTHSLIIFISAMSHDHIPEFQPQSGKSLEHKQVLLKACPDEWCHLSIIR